MGLPYLGPYNVNSIMNPILVHCLGLGYFFNMYREQAARAAGRRGDPAPPGAVGVPPGPPPRATSTSSRRCCAETTDPDEIEAKFEEQYATDEWYRHLYRTSYAYHGVHPFYMWYWGAHGRDHAGDVIFVGGEPKSVARLGFRRADSLRDALEMAKDTVGSQPVDRRTSTRRP